MTPLSLPLFVRDTTTKRYRKAQPEEVVQAAQTAIDHLFLRGESMSSVQAVRQFVATKLATRDQEVFAVIFLDNKNRVLAFEELFFGTIDSAAVYPRPVVKRALFHNAAAVILAHNHPSGNPEPSRADEQLTRRLQDALALLDIRVVDHLIVGATRCVSLAERGVL